MATLNTLVAKINKMEGEIKSLTDENLRIKKQLKEEIEKPDNTLVLKLSIDQVKLDVKKALDNKYDDKNILLKLKSIESDILEINKPNDIIELNGRIKKIEKSVSDIKKTQSIPAPKVKQLSVNDIKNEILAIPKANNLTTDQVIKMISDGIGKIKHPAQITVNEINSMICDKINNIKQTKPLSTEDINQEIDKRVNEKFITNLYRNK